MRVHCFAADPGLESLNLLIDYLERPGTIAAVGWDTDQETIGIEVVLAMKAI